MQPSTEDSRSYAFRSFKDRRNPQDRRLLVVGSRCSSPLPGIYVKEDDGFCQLTREELMRLLSEFDD